MDRPQTSIASLPLGEVSVQNLLNFAEETGEVKRIAEVSSRREEKILPQTQTGGTPSLGHLSWMSKKGVNAVGHPKK